MNDIMPVVAARVFDFQAFCELERTQANLAKMDNINRLIDKKFGPSKPRPILMHIWFET